jgi:hypothetical protein
MPTRDVFVEEVDRLLETQKVMAGADGVTWQMGRNADERCIKVPLEIGGELLGPELLVVAFPQVAGKYSVLIVHHVAVCRLDVVPSIEYHTNPLPLPGERHAAKVFGPHFHSWGLNRNRIEAPIKLQKLRMAEPYDGVVKLMSALRWFCGETKIMVPHSVNLQLPEKEGLF